jgi:signal transduction histidine kinase
MKIETASQKFSGFLKREEEETKRIAKELHHDLTQSLSAINFDLGEAIHQIKGGRIRAIYTLMYPQKPTVKNSCKSS